MAMSDAEAKALIDVLLRAYPTYPAEAETRDLYAQALRNDPHSAQVAAAAVSQWVLNESWMPKVNELLDAIRIEAAQRRSDDSARLRTAGALPPGAAVPVRLEAVKLRLALWRQVQAEMAMTDARRASMTAADREDYAARYAARLDELVREHADELIAAEPLETYVCPQCLDTGWIEESVVPGVTTALRPCPCRPELYDKWRAGHFAPNHSCAACDAARRGKRTSSLCEAAHGDRA